MKVRTQNFNAGRPWSGKRAGFTLVELLLVIAVLTLLAMATVPAMRGSLDGITIRGAADLMESEFSLGRQAALSRNLPVEVRIYRYDDGSGAAWRMVATVIPAAVSNQAADEWITPGRVLPGGVVMDDSEEYSTVLSNTMSEGDVRQRPWTGVEAGTAPGKLKDLPYVAFRFKPDGSTSLGGAEPWCLTLKNPLSQSVGNAPAANYVSLVLDSHTGRVLFYQP